MFASWMVFGISVTLLLMDVARRLERARLGSAPRNSG
jgi:hypothetical protein